MYPDKFVLREGCFDLFHRTMCNINAVGGMDFAVIFKSFYEMNVLKNQAHCFTVLTYKKIVAHHMSIFFSCHRLAFAFTDGN